MKGHIIFCIITFILFEQLCCILSDSEDNREKRADVNANSSSSSLTSSSSTSVKSTSSASSSTSSTSSSTSKATSAAVKAQSSPSLKAGAPISQGSGPALNAASGSGSKNTTEPQPSSSSTSRASLQEDPCFVDPLLQNFCVVPETLTDVSFWDLYSVMFSDTVTDALLLACKPGQWCLHNRFDYFEALIMEKVKMIMKSDIAEAMCDPEVDKCIDALVKNFHNCSLEQQMYLTAAAIDLTCDLRKRATLTESCTEQYVMTLHVNMADMMRGKPKQNLDDGLKDKTCDSQLVEMTKSYICTENSCPGEMEVLEKFQPWSWFIKYKEVVEQACDLDVTECEIVAKGPILWVYASDIKLVIGVSIATMVAVIILTFLVFTCYKRHQTLKIGSKEGYEKLLNEDSET